MSNLTRSRLLIGLNPLWVLESGRGIWYLGGFFAGVDAGLVAGLLACKR